MAAIVCSKLCRLVAIFAQGFLIAFRSPLKVLHWGGHLGSYDSLSLCICSGGHIAHFRKDMCKLNFGGLLIADSNVNYNYFLKLIKFSMSQSNSTKKVRQTKASSADKLQKQKQESEVPFGKVRPKSKEEVKEVPKKRLYREIAQSEIAGGDSRSSSRKRAKKEASDLINLNPG